MGNNIDEIQTLWKQREINIQNIDISKLRNKSLELERKILFRNMTEWMACLIVIPVFAYKASIANTLWSTIMYSEVVLGAFYVAFRIYKNGRYKKEVDPNENSLLFIKQLKANLNKQIRLLKTARYWYVAPLMIGVVGATLEQIYLKWNLNHLPWGAIIYLVGTLLFSAFIIYLNEVLAVNGLKKEINYLD